MRVSLSKSDRHFSARAHQPLLQVALDAGLMLEAACRRGNCGRCRARLLEGAVRYPNGQPLGLSDQDSDAGLVLLCQAQAASDVCIELLTVRAVDVMSVKRWSCRIASLRAMGPDVIQVMLRLPPAEPFRFDAGQYIDILWSYGRRRNFPIASPPHSRLVELHVRRVIGDEFEKFFADMRVGGLLTIEGPLGHFFYRPAASPLILVGGGTGLTPLMSIWRHVLETGIDRPITLYWGARERADLYCHDELEYLARQSPTFHYRPVLITAGAEWQGRRGPIHEAVLGDFPMLEGVEIYVSGPPAMIDASCARFKDSGADDGQLHINSFD